MAIKIAKPISEFEVVSPNTPESTPEQPEVPALVANTDGLPNNVVQMHEKVERPETLVGSTYKIKTPLSDHALYVTINDIVLNPQTPYEKRRPFEIFINSKNLDHYQWIVALTRIISAVFMVDVSGSTKGWINDAERECLVLLCEALQILGDRYAIYGFSGMTRKRCEL